MVTIPSTENLGIDISIALITGGAVTTWLTLLLDRTSKRRQEYLEISKDKINKINKVEPICMRIGSYLGVIARELRVKGDKDEVYYITYYIARYLNSWYELLDNYGYLQLHDLHSENIIQILVQNLFVTLKKDPFIGLERLSILVRVIKENPSFSSFKEKLSPPPNSDQYFQYDDLVYAFKQYIDKLRKDEKKLQEVTNKADWYYILIEREISFTYQIYYGEKNIKSYFTNKELPGSLLDYIAEEHPQYLKRLLKLRLV